MSDPKYQNSSRDHDLHYVHVRRDAREYKDRLKQARKKKAESFGSQEVDIRDYIISPEGWEGVMFSFYFIAIPYVTGVIFLFLFVARGDMHNFLILDLTHFFIVWAIGYEVVASIILILLFVSYIKYVLSKDKLDTSNRLKKRY